MRLFDFMFLQVSTDAGREYAAEVNAIFYETSAKTAQNVNELFIKIGKYHNHIIFIICDNVIIIIIKLITSL